MGKNRDYATVFGSKLKWVLEKSNCQKVLIDISQRLMDLARDSANLITKYMDRQESQLQALDIDFDAEDISTEDYMKAMKERQKIEEECQNALNIELAKVNAAEKFEQQKQEKAQLRLENANAQIETLDQYLATVNCGYFDQGAA